MSPITNIAMHWRTIRKKARFLQGSSLLVFSWPLAALLLCAIGWSTLLAALERDRHEVVNASMQLAASLARGYADQLARTLEATDQMLLHVKYEWKLSGGKLRLEEVMQTGLFPPASFFFRRGRWPGRYADDQHHRRE